MNAFVASLPAASFAGPAAGSSPACMANTTPSCHAGFRQSVAPARMHHMSMMRSHCATTLSPSTSSSPSFFSSAAFGTAVPHQQQQQQQQELQSQPHQPNTRVQPRMDVTIVVGENEPVESALRRFKRDVSKSGHLFELKRRRYFETNTEKRLRKAAASRRKAKMARQASRKQKH